ncbi:nitroreductase [Actinomyces slackii]|uniref:NAD(P)H nitroreductase Spy0809 n=1 Tax=Actinomyces slackii TaxID=52774 RepID=A0A3S4UNL5_9ACTO|nr:nitroreductase [Actinomyces slackii]VEG74684.1 Putative NAD(P)H nitroreductase Spy0809 [Actinomyces slackii]
MEFSEVVARRHSVRDFTDQPVDRQDLVEIVRTAQKAPSWANSQPWRVRIATGQTLARIKELHAARVASGEQGHTEFPVMPRTEWSTAAQANMADLFNQISVHFADEPESFGASQGLLFNAQAIVYLTIPVGSSLWSIHDLGAFSALIALAAFDRGLGAINAYELVKYPDIVREVMGIGEEETLAIGLALGHPAGNPLGDFAPTRQDVEDILTIAE